MYQEITTQKPILLRLFLTFFIVVELNILAHVPIPGLLIVSDSLFLLILLSFFSYYVLQCMRYRQVNTLLICITLMLLVPFLSGIQGQRVFGQPFVYGFLAERTKFLIISPLLLVYLLDGGFLDLWTLEKVLIRIALIYFFTALFLYLFIDAQLFEGTSFVILSANKGARYNINQALVLILLFYSLYKGIEKLQLNYIALAVTILVYLFIFVKGRSLLFAVFIALVHLVFTRLAWRQRIAFLSFSIILLFVLGGVGLFFFSDNLDSIFSLFSSALSVVMGGEAQDGSAASRVIQVNIALDGIKQNPFLGNGFLSVQWNGGFAEKYRFFYPSDIGWLGLIYVNGIVGFVLLNVPFFLSWKYAQKMKKQPKDLFLKAIESFMFYLFIHSAFAGFAIKKIGIIALPFAIIYFYRYWVFDDKKEERQA